MWEDTKAWYHYVLQYIYTFLSYLQYGVHLLEAYHDVLAAVLELITAELCRCILFDPIASLAAT